MIEFDQSTLQAPSEDLVLYSKGIDAGSDIGYQRGTKRVALKRKVLVIPVDSEAKPTGEPFIAVTRNLSAAGVSIIHAEPVKDNFIVVELSSKEGNRLQVLVEVLRCRRRRVSFYEISGRIIRKLDTDT
ncbi:MAG: PilZ domain-containing protein [Porticoccus sp.]|nr:PilZ domain-containing protein [Porticoccus sp.]MBQ0807660.1 PilZ domain-containing protein [Porticoccus sp.]